MNSKIKNGMFFYVFARYSIHTYGGDTSNVLTCFDGYIKGLKDAGILDERFSVIDYMECVDAMFHRKDLEAAKTESDKFLDKAAK